MIWTSKIFEFAEFLKNLKASEILGLSDADVKGLAEISSIVETMAKSVQGNK